MMTTVAELDTTGVGVVSGAAGDNVALLPALIFDQLYEEMFEELVAPGSVSLDFCDEPWLQLPKIEDLQYLWLTMTPLEHLITAMAIKAHGDGADLPQFVAQQRWLADMELALKKEAVQDDAGADDTGGSGEAATVASAETGGGGSDLPGGREDGDTVGTGGEDCQHQDIGSAPQIPRKRGARKAARGRGAVGDAADDSPAAA